MPIYRKTKPYKLPKSLELLELQICMFGAESSNQPQIEFGHLDARSKCTCDL